jgi:hypothetical protein
MAEPGEPIATVALGERVDPANAPNPSNDSERLVFRQVYETLVRVDCDGRVHPGLAASWRAEGRLWIVTVRADARFADGAPVTSADVVSSWARRGNGGALPPQVSPLVESVVAVDDVTLAIALRSPDTDAPVALAHTDLAVAKHVPDSPWPLGTRSARIVSDDPRSVITVTRGPAGAAAIDGGDSLPPVRFLATPGRDQRDLLDAGVDLLITRDRSTLDYAATLPQFQSVPLEWLRVHVLLTPGRTPAAPPLLEDARQALAEDAVRGEARGARGPFWWQALRDCDVAAAPRDASAPATGRIVYDSGDAAARDLAERIVGLGSGSGPGAAAILGALSPNRGSRDTWRATGVTGDALAQARRRGTDAGYIVSLDRRPLDACRELQGMAAGARWLDPDTAVPLVDTRMRAIVRRGRTGLIVEWDGGLSLAGAEGVR